MTQSTQTTAAECAARRNLLANRNAIAATQPDLRIDDPADIGEWLFGRDGYLTARDISENWLTGCSLPRRAAEEVLRKLSVAGPVACFLAPAHAAQVRVALGHLAPEQALIALVRHECDLSVILSCDDFSEDIGAHRLWFATDDNGLRALLQTQTGLSVPSQFIRLPGCRDELIPAAQQVLSEITTARAETARKLRDAFAARGSDRVCLIAPSRFRLWNDLGDAAAPMVDSACARIDLDDPAGSSPMAILEAIGDCGAVFTIDTGRADSPGLLPDDLPWITWVSSPRVPAFTGAGKRDQLLVIDPAIRHGAKEQGWETERVHLAGLPPTRECDTREPQALVIIDDNKPLEAPPDLIEFSSHVVLWESIANTLLADPFALDENVVSFLDAAARRLEIDPQSINRARFVRDLILPAYAQGIARALVRAGLPIKLYGRGWDQILEFAQRAAGAIASRAELDAVLEQPLALVHCWPWRGAHAIDAAGKLVLRRTDSSLRSIVAAAEQILRNPQASARRRVEPVLSSDLIKKVMDRARSDS